MTAGPIPSGLEPCSADAWHRARLYLTRVAQALSAWCKERGQPEYLECGFINGFGSVAEPSAPRIGLQLRDDSSHDRPLVVQIYAGRSVISSVEFGDLTDLRESLGLSPPAFGHPSRQADAESSALLHLLTFQSVTRDLLKTIVGASVQQPGPWLWPDNLEVAFKSTTSEIGVSPGDDTYPAPHIFYKCRYDKAREHVRIRRIAPELREAFHFVLSQVEITDWNDGQQFQIDEI